MLQRHQPRILATALLLASLASVASAQQGIQLSSFPLRSAADGRSTVTITAIVRSANGSVVPDGTLVNFTASQGRFRQDSVPTQRGVVNVVYIAGNLPGLVTISASALAGNVPPATLQVELVADRSQLSSAQEYIEVYSDGFLEYTADSRFVSATTPDRGVSVRYRDILIKADDVQIDSGNYIVRAKNARLRHGKIDQDFEELYIQLNQRTGHGITAMPSSSWETIMWNGHGLSFMESDGEDGWKLAEIRQRVVPVEIQFGKLKAANLKTFDPNRAKFQELDVSPSTIRAKKAVVFPNRGVQFQKAEVYVGDTKVLSMPMYELTQSALSQSPLVTDQFVSMWNNSLTVNYPYFTSVKPGQTSLFRFRTGELYGRSSVASRGMFLDYELNWNKGDELDGSVGVQGLGRNDWVASVRQSWQIGDRANAFFQAQSPGLNSAFGSFGVSNQFNGFQTQFNGSLNRTFRGLKYTSQDYGLSLEKDPIKIGKLPAQLNLGLNGSSVSNSLLETTDQSTGVYARLQSNVLPVPGVGTLRLAGQVRQANSSRTGGRTSYLGTATFFTPVARWASLTTTYDYVQDGVEDRVLGNHRVSVQGFARLGRTELDFNGLRALEADRYTLYGNLSYFVSKTWRLGYQYTFDRFNESQYLDYFVTLGYSIGWREVGLIWSRQTNRIGFQILGSRIY
jgi:hypothetical protein